MVHELYVLPTRGVPNALYLYKRCSEGSRSIHVAYERCSKDLLAVRVTYERWLNSF